MSVFVCCDTTNYSVKAKQGTPSPAREMAMKTADVMMSPADVMMSPVDVMMSPVVVEQQCHAYSFEPNQCRSVDDYMTAQPTLIASHATTSDCANTVQARRHVVGDGEAANPSTSTKLKYVQSEASDVVLDDIDLICSIADTYDLGEDSDTFSFISNFLYSNHGLGSVLSAQKSNRFSAISLDQATTLSSDQLYPDSVSKQPTKTKYIKRHKQKRTIVSTKVSSYTNSKGSSRVL